MTDLLKKAIDVLNSLPPERQEEVARIMIAYADYLMEGEEIRSSEVQIDFEPHE